MDLDAKRLLFAGLIIGLWCVLVQAEPQHAEPAPAEPSATAEPPASVPRPGQRLFQREFARYTVLLLTPLDQPWQACWNDAAQMAVFRHATNQVVMTTQFLQFPLDADLRAAVGDRSRFLDLALRKYCALQPARSPDPAVQRQPLRFGERQIGRHFFRYVSLRGHDALGPRRGYFYLMLRGTAEQPKFTGDALVCTLGYPESLPADEVKSMHQLFDLLLQNLSFN
ncbi:MAG: hypothetical protein N3A53_01240 [Verrucomicrobiae bacterium]|nr:hypothetical protein [Verrucomicrobiae bacterium]